MRCGNCEALLLEGAKFCQKCGAAVPETMSPVSTIPITTATASSGEQNNDPPPLTAPVDIPSPPPATDVDTELTQQHGADTDVAPQQAVEDTADAPSPPPPATDAVDAPPPPPPAVAAVDAPPPPPAAAAVDAPPPQDAVVDAPSSPIAPKPVAGENAVHFVGAVPEETIGGSAIDMMPAQEAPPKKKPSKKMLLIILVVVVVLAIGAVLGFVVIPEITRSGAYNEAMALYDDGDYEGAASAFGELGNYSEAPYYAEQSQHHVDYNKGVELFASGDFTGARAVFAELSADGFSDASTKVKECDYALADAMLAAGDYEGAYNAFLALGDFNDAAARAAGSLVSFPGDGVIYHNGDFYSSSITLRIDASGTPWPVYLKIYSGETLVATMFINQGGSASIDIPSGTYTIKEAYGERWFGEAQMFGKNGTYTVMLFDGENESVYLEPNYEYTITLYMSEEGNVNNRAVDAGSF